MKTKNIPNIEIEQIIKNFSNVLSIPQYDNFKIMINGKLISSGGSILKCSNYGSKDQSSINRFMNSKAVDDSKLLMNHFEIINNHLPEDQTKSLILDDTLAHHFFSKKIDGVGNYHDHLQGGYSKGHNVVVSGIHCQNLLFPLQSELYLKKSDVSDPSNFKDKIQIAKEMILTTKEKFSYENVLIDSWYSATELLKLISENEKNFFTVLKSNRKVTIGKRNKSVKEQSKRLFPRDFKMEKINNKKYFCATREGYLKGVGKIKIVFTYPYDEFENKLSEPNYIVSNNINLSAKEILETYSLRWPIEVFNRDVKQNLGFEKSIIRKLTGIKRHFLITNIVQTIIVIKKLYENKTTTSGKMQIKAKSEIIKNIMLKEIYSLEGIEDCALRIASMI